MDWDCCFDEEDHFLDSDEDGATGGGYSDENGWEPLVGEALAQEHRDPTLVVPGLHQQMQVDTLLALLLLRSHSGKSPDVLLAQDPATGDTTAMAAAVTPVEVKGAQKAVSRAAGAARGAAYFAAERAYFAAGRARNCAAWASAAHLLVPSSFFASTSQPFGGAASMAYPAAAVNATLPAPSLCPLGAAPVESVSSSRALALSRIVAGGVAVRARTSYLSKAGLSSAIGTVAGEEQTPRRSRASKRRERRRRADADAAAAAAEASVAQGPTDWRLDPDGEDAATAALVALTAAAAARKTVAPLYSPGELAQSRGVRSAALQAQQAAAGARDASQQAWVYSHVQDQDAWTGIKRWQGRRRAIREAALY